LDCMTESAENIKKFYLIIRSFYSS